MSGLSISQAVLLFFEMNANQTVAAFTNGAVMRRMYVGALVGYAGSVVINNLMGLELTRTSRIVSECCHGDE